MKSICFAAGIALAVGITCTPALAAGTSPKSTMPTLSVQANKQMNLLHSEIEILDLPADVGRGFGLDVTIGGLEYSLDLAPYRITSPDFVVKTWDDVNGYVEVDPGPLTTVRGAVVGDPGSAIAGGLVSGGIRLQVVFSDGEMFTIEPMRDAEPGAHVVYKNTDVIIDPNVGCGMTEVVDGIDVEQADPGGVASGAIECTELAIDCDLQWFQIFGTVAACVAEANAIINTVNLQWESQVDLTYQVTGVIVRQTQIYTTNGASDLLCQFSNEWWANNPVANRDLAHLFTGRNLSGSTIGLATDYGVMCDPEACGTFPCNCGTFGPDGSYCLSQTEYSSTFACTTDLVSHEMGHLFNAFHCSCPGFTMNPSAGACSNNFSAATVTSITNYAAGLPCLALDCAGFDCPGDGSCFEPNGSPGCNVEGCCEIVCGVDPFCCENSWDQLCANQAAELCGNAVCPGAGNCCEPNGSPGCDDVNCCNTVCFIDPFCCDNTWDGLCATQAENLCGNLCFFDQCPGEGSCFFANGTPGCDDQQCCQDVCEDDAFCCETEWDGICAGSAIDLCGDSACPGGGSCCESNGTPGCDDPACCNAVCSNDPFCCDNQWDNLCVIGAEAQCGELCVPWPQCPGEGSCFFSNGSPGCDDEECCVAVCENDAFCCDTTWDTTCANQANDLCGNAACPGQGHCALPNGTPGCDDQACCNAVCIEDPFCCDVEWDQICANFAIEVCGVTPPPFGACCLPDGSCIETIEDDCTGDYQGDDTTCANANCPVPFECPGTGNCFFPNDTPGCQDEVCCEIVCAQDSFCCDVEWDGLCAGDANDLCGNDACPGDGPCNAPNGSVGCDDQACCNAVCAQDAFCCGTEWDQICADAAIEICNIPPPLLGACCLPDGSCIMTTAGDCDGDYQGDGTECANIECDQPIGACCLPDGSCIMTSAGKCAGDYQGDGTTCGQVECDQPFECPGSGCCFEANGTPGCVIEACCNAVCAVDPFCCDTEWDGLCASEAVDICYDPPCPGNTNGDGSVDVQDLVNVVLAWGQTGHGPNDVEPSCLVDVGDLIQVVLNWGPCP